MSQESLQENHSSGDFSPENTQSSSLPPQSFTTEKTFTQSEVDKIAGKVRRETIEKFRNEQPAPQASPSYPNSQSLYSMDDVKRVAAETVQEQFKAQNEQFMQQQYMAEGQRIADEFRSKIETDREKFPELKDKLSKVNLAAIPAVIHLANSMENTSAIMNELLIENPARLASINLLAQTEPGLARDAVMKLSKSISINEKAAQSKVANEPLSQLKPSTIGVDNGSMSVTDYRKIFR
jgi:hypothetical protein